MTRKTGRALWRVACSALVLATSAAAPAIASTADAPASLRIHQLEVGQGDAALITTPEGHRVLIDAGPRNAGVADWLASEGINALDLVIASHAHADHIGGMAQVLSRFVVRAYMDNGMPHTTATYRRTMAAVEREPDLLYLEATNRTITVGSASFRVLAPAGIDPSQNNNSVGVLVTFGEFRALFTGDSETPQLDHWLATDSIPRVHVLKAAHHGSWNGVTDTWAQATSPALVLISVGRNSYGHPSPWVEHLWSTTGATIHRTDRDGTIEVTATPDGRFSVRTSR